MERRKRIPLDRVRLSRMLLLALGDVILFGVSSVLSLVVRFEFALGILQTSGFLPHVLRLLPASTVVMLVVFWFAHLYDSLWEFAGEREMLHIIAACAITVVVQSGLQFLCGWNVPRSFPLLQFLFFTVMVGSFRFSYRVLRHLLGRATVRTRRRRRTMLVGAGEAGAMLLQEIQRSRFSQNEVVCIIDDAPRKHGKYMFGVRILGGRERIVQVAKDYNVEEIIIAMPSAPVKERRAILNICQETGCHLRTLPGIYQLVNGEVNVQKIRNVEIEDLLERESVKVNLDEIAGYVRDRTVLVTGGGGSIGSELCRQVAAHHPRRLIIFDIYENNAYAIQQELRRTCPALDLVVLIGSVRDKKRVDMIFDQYRPEIVYHAAAHKHVPLMEDSPNEAVKNNVFGTWNVAFAADRVGVKTMVLISSDKAVNPTNIMGATKRICEMIVRSFSQRSQTKFVAVRFGNVLGSNGSVIPLFRKQIEAGGPVTVTHKDIIRYFMTIPEAVSLVLQAGAYARGGEIFVLDMGDPVKIDDLARNMIRLSGFEPDVDIAVEYTGLRPGEKLYEELLLSEEGLDKTPNELIFIGHLAPIEPVTFGEKLSALRRACNENVEDIKAMVAQIVPEYHAEPDHEQEQQEALAAAQ